MPTRCSWRWLAENRSRRPPSPDRRPTAAAPRSKRPGVQLQPGPKMLPSRPLPELSCAVAPAVSSNVQCATMPFATLAGAIVATSTGPGVQPSPAPSAAASAPARAAAAFHSPPAASSTRAARGVRRARPRSARSARRDRAPRRSACTSIPSSTRRGAQRHAQADAGIDRGRHAVGVAADVRRRLVALGRQVEDARAERHDRLQPPARGGTAAALRRARWSATTFA